MSELSKDKISHQRAHALRSVLAEKPDFSSNFALSNFLSAYFLCEAVANKLVEYFEVDVPPELVKPKRTKCFRCGAENERSVAKNKSNGHFKTLDVGKIKKALIHFALDFPSDEADAVFKSGAGIDGQRTARQLRNDYAHSLSASASREISERAPVLLDLMMRFHMAVQNRTSKETT